MGETTRKQSEKDYFEEQERIIWNIRCEKQRLLIETDNDNEEEFIDLCNETEFHLQRLQEVRNLQKAYIEREELLNRISDWKDHCHKESSKRLWLTYVGFFALFQFFLVIAVKAIVLDNATFIEALALSLMLIIPSIVIAGIHFIINFSIFNYLFKKDREEYNHWTYLKKEIDTIEDIIAGDPRPTDQEIDQIKQRYEKAKMKIENFPTN